MFFAQNIFNKTCGKTALKQNRIWLYLHLRYLDSADYLFVMTMAKSKHFQRFSPVFGATTLSRMTHSRMTLSIFVQLGLMKLTHLNTKQSNYIQRRGTMPLMSNATV